MKRYVIALIVIGLHGVTVGGAERKQPVLTLNKPCLIADYGGNKICIIDKQGKITWQIKAARPQDIWVLPSGNILFSHIKGAKEVTKDKKVVWQYKTEGNNEIHACQPLAGGLVMVAESGPMRIVEVDRDGRIVKKVKFQTRQKRPHGQMRKVRKTREGTYLVGQYADGILREYDGAGRIVWEMKQKNAFGATRLPNGNSLVSTGDAHVIKEVTKEGKVVWEIKENDLQGNPLRFIAGMQRLPNGNTLVCNWGGHGHIDKQPQIFEVTKDKKVVGVLHDYNQFSTISAVLALDTKGDPTKFNVLR